MRRRLLVTADAELYRIHYFLYYRLVDDEAVEVLALWHARRGQGPPI